MKRRNFLFAISSLFAGMGVLGFTKASPLDKDTTPENSLAKCCLNNQGQQTETPSDSSSCPQSYSLGVYIDAGVQFAMGKIKVAFSIERDIMGTTLSDGTWQQNNNLIFRMCAYMPSQNRCEELHIKISNVLRMTYYGRIEFETLDATASDRLHMFLQRLPDLERYVQVYSVDSVDSVAKNAVRDVVVF